MTVFELLAKIGIDTSKYEKGLGDAEGKAESFASNVGKTISKGVKFISTMSVAAVGVAGAGITALTKQAVDAYGTYEQLVGGVEKIFGDASKIVQQNARDAYKTAGMSANEYMETVTSFSASLIQSLGGDTQKAADVADMALRDMSDNANTFGTDMKSIMNAYQGFSKQNYAMLDNLKLGYGGSASEVERLIRDAEKMDSTFSVVHKKTKKGQDEIKFGYADVVQAIHIVQENMNVTGTTAKEASKTIQGTAGALKSAWQNLIIGLGNKDQVSLQPLIDNVVSSALNLVDNIKPVALQAVKGVGKLITGFAPVIAEVLPEMINDVLPPLVDAIVTIVDKASEVLPSLIERLLPSIITAVTSIIKSLVVVLPKILLILSKQLPTILQQLIPAMLEVLPDVLKAVVEIVFVIAKALADNANLIMDAIMSLIHLMVDTFLTPENIKQFVVIAVQIILTIAEAIIKNIPEILGAIVIVLANVVQALIEAFPEIVDLVIKFLVNLGEALGNTLYELLGDSLYNAWTQVTDWIKGIFAWLSEKANVFLENVVEFLNNPREYIKKVLGNIKTFLTTSISNIKTIITNAFNTIRDIIPKALENIKQKLADGLEKVKEKFTSIFDKLKEAAQKAFDIIKNIFSGKWELPKIKVPHFKIDGKFNLDPTNFSVPKIKVDWYRKAYTAPYFLDEATIFGSARGKLLGGGEGSGSEIIAGTDRLMDMMKDAVKDVTGSMPTTVTINVYGAEGQDIRELAKEVSRELQNLINDKEKAYA